MSTGKSLQNFENIAALRGVVVRLFCYSRGRGMKIDKPIGAWEAK